MQQFLDEQKINKEIFTQNEQRCNIQNENSEVVNSCSHLLRITHALKYYQSLLSSKNLNKQDLLGEFCCEVYCTFLDDYIHLISVHSFNIVSIGQDLYENHNFNPCKISACKLTQRHYRNRIQDENMDDLDFYTEKFDNVHFYLFHLNDLGLRMTNNNKTTDSKITDQKNDNYVDAKLLKIQNEINSKIKKCDLQRLNDDKNTKFNIMIGDTDEKFEIGNTFLDDMMTEIVDDKHIDEITLYQLRKYLTFEQYDSDSLINDVNLYSEQKQCNILLGMNNDVKCIENIVNFVNYVFLSSVTYNKTFSTGIVFWYWKYYKNINDEKYEKENSAHWLSQLNDNDFGGYSISELYVRKHHSSLKQEALLSEFISVEQYKKLVIKKANEYYKTRKCKKLKCTAGGRDDNKVDDPLHYNISYGDKLKKKHLHALILYSDFTRFCTHFSKTFRKIRWNEKLTSIKQRNSKYYSISKYLRELIQYYGINGDSYEHRDDRNYENGPFYTGISVMLNIPQFSIRLNAPTSTTTQQEIAMRFSGSGGLILQLNNVYPPGNKEVFFDCSWISNFPEEAECIYFGGRYKIEVESVLVMKGCKNYQEIINAFYKFDKILSGEATYKMKIKTRDIRTINACMSNYIDTSSTNLDLNDYVIDTFYLFCKTQTQVILNLCEMSRMRHQTNKSFIGLIMHDIKEQNYLKVKNNNNNFFKRIIFFLF
eukprot:382678_1